MLPTPCSLPCCRLARNRHSKSTAASVNRRKGLLRPATAEEPQKALGLCKPRGTSCVHRRDVDVPGTCAGRQKDGLCDSGRLKDVAGCDAVGMRICDLWNVRQTNDECRTHVRVRLHYRLK